MIICGNGIFDFLEPFIKPLWGIVVIVFIAILFVISKTIIREAKKRQKGEKPMKTRSDYYREIEAYSEMPHIRVSFNNKKTIVNMNNINQSESDIESSISELVSEIPDVSENN